MNFKIHTLEYKFRQDDFLPLVDLILDDTIVPLTESLIAESLYPKVRIINVTSIANILLNDVDNYIFIEQMPGRLILPNLTDVVGQELSITNLSNQNVTMSVFDGDTFKDGTTQVVLRPNFTYKYIGYKIEGDENGIWINIV